MRPGANTKPSKRAAPGPWVSEGDAREPRGCAGTPAPGSQAPRAPGQEGLPPTMGYECCLGYLMRGMKILAQRGHPAVSIWFPYRFPNLYGNRCLCCEVTSFLVPRAHRQGFLSPPPPNSQVRTSSLYEIRALVSRGMEEKRKLIKATALFSNTGEWNQEGRLV